jgi:short-subunit dehydrogenase
MESDFLDPDRIKATVDRITAQGGVDIVLIAHGTLPEQADCQSNLGVCKNTLEINGISPVLFAEAFAGIMEKANHGTLAIIGSVAGDRGRKKNYTYGSAKGLVDRYTQGLQHRLARTKVNIVLLKPGPTETPMTAKLMSDTLKASPVALVSQQIVNAIEKKRLVAYIPFKWRIIMWTIKHIPVNIFNKLDI